MIVSLKKILDANVRATDGDVGKVVDFYLDDYQWFVRYMVVDTGERWVLIPPSVLGEPIEENVFRVELPSEKIRQSPGVEQARPVSRQFETQLYDYYEWPYYWGYGFVPSMGINPTPMTPVPLPVTGEETPETGEQPPREEERHLRSLQEVKGYRIQARDGDIGHVDDFLANSEDWNIFYMVVDTGGWISGRKVLVSPSWIQEVRWPDGRVQIDLSRDTIKNSPVYDSEVVLTEEYHNELENYYRGQRR